MRTFGDLKDGDLFRPWIWNTDDEPHRRAFDGVVLVKQRDRAVVTKHWCASEIGSLRSWVGDDEPVDRVRVEP